MFAIRRFYNTVQRFYTFLCLRLKIIPLNLKYITSIMTFIYSLYKCKNGKITQTILKKLKIEF